LIIFYFHLGHYYIIPAGAAQLERSVFGKIRNPEHEIPNNIKLPKINVILRLNPDWESGRIP
jgi:hypothetical protein